MKKVPLILVFLFFLSNIDAQNWQPIRAGWVYSYESAMPFNNDGIINYPKLEDTLSNYIHNVWIDSVSFLGADTVYSLNQIVKDTSTVWYPMLGGAQAGFLQYKMQKNADGSYLFFSPDSFLIKPDEILGSGWLYNSSDSAYVISISIDSILGQSDSIKTIIIANTDTIRISKNWGIIQFPNWETGDYYRLVGFQNDSNSNGLKIPDFWDIFDLQVGDLLMYYGFNWEGPSQPMPRSCSHKLKVEITDITIQGDSIIIQSNSLYNNCLYDMANCTGVLNDLYYTNQIVLKASDFQFLNLYNANESASGLVNYIGKKDEFEGQLSKILTTTWCHVEFTKGLGLTYSSFAGIGFDGYIQLIGYVHNGDTTGIIYSDSITVLAVEEISANSQPTLKVSLYPNPSNGNSQLQFSALTEKPVALEIINTQGQLLRRAEIASGQANYEIDAMDLPNGVYWLRVAEENGGAAVLKWVLLR